jgi:hypothetical protein
MLFMVEYPNIFTFTLSCSHDLQDSNVWCRWYRSDCSKLTSPADRMWQNTLLGIWEEYDILKEKSEIRNQWLNWSNGPLKQTKENWKWKEQWDCVGVVCTQQGQKCSSIWKISVTARIFGPLRKAYRWALLYRWGIWPLVLTIVKKGRLGFPVKYFDIVIFIIKR